MLDVVCSVSSGGIVDHDVLNARRRLRIDVRRTCVDVLSGSDIHLVRSVGWSDKPSRRSLCTALADQFVILSTTGRMARLRADDLFRPTITSDDWGCSLVLSVCHCESVYAGGADQSETASGTIIPFGSFPYVRPMHGLVSVGSLQTVMSSSVVVVCGTISGTRFGSDVCLILSVDRSDKLSL
jgi:hypothetical protein